jgi:hypothetical protein
LKRLVGLRCAKENQGDAAIGVGSRRVLYPVCVRVLLEANTVEAVGNQREEKNPERALVSEP